MQRRFIDAFQLYTDSIVQEAIDRDNSYVRSTQNYLELRRDTAGVKACFVLLQLKEDIPDEIIHHPTIETLTAAATDLIAIGNDILSYTLEWAPQRPP